MLSIDLFTILWTVIDLIVLYLLMRRFLFKPVNAVLETRAKSVQEDLTQAQAQKAEAQELRKQYEDRFRTGFVSVRNSKVITDRYEGKTRLCRLTEKSKTEF